MQVVRRDGIEYFFPCFFVGAPDAPPGAQHPLAPRPRIPLEVTGVIDKIHISWDGTPALAAPYGYITVEKV